jgi:hypothetical protein
MVKSMVCAMSAWKPSVSGVPTASSSSTIRVPASALPPQQISPSAARRSPYAVGDVAGFAERFRDAAWYRRRGSSLQCAGRRCAESMPDHAVLAHAEFVRASVPMSAGLPDLASENLRVALCCPSPNRRRWQATRARRASRRRRPRLAMRFSASAFECRRRVESMIGVRMKRNRSTPSKFTPSDLRLQR